MSIQKTTNGLAIVLLVSVAVFGITEQVTASVSGPNYVDNPADCPREDAQFPGQSCPFGQVICGVNNSDIPQCITPGSIIAPTSSANSNTLYTSSLAGGYIIDCYEQPLDLAAPYCDNNGAALCNRDPTCYGTEFRDTTCTANSFVAFTCGSCRSGFQDCNVSTTPCEVQTGVTNYDNNGAGPTEDNTNYGASCSAACDSSYLDCNSDLGTGGNGCEINVGGSCGTNAEYGSSCDGASGDCQCSSIYFDCDASGPSAGNGCEVQTATSCTTGDGATGTYSGCTCVPNKSNFVTGVQSVYSTTGALLNGKNLGTGSLIEFSSKDGTVFKVFNSGAVKIGIISDGDGEAGTLRWTGTDFEGYTGAIWKSLTSGGGGGGGSAIIQEGDVTIVETGSTLDFNADDFTITEVPANEANISLDTTGLRLRLDDTYVNTSGDIMTGSLVITSSGSLTASGALATQSGVVINMSNEAKDSVLAFGHSLGAETLKFLNAEHRFEFSDDVHIAGKLTVSGGLVIDGTTIINNTNFADVVSAALSSSLKVSTGAGLSVNIAPGDYRLNGNTTQHTGTIGQSVTDASTNYIYFGSGGLTVSTVSFPTNESYIPLASVVTSGGSITSINDRRVMNSDDREATIVRTYAPEYDGAAYEQDGSSNVGQLSVTSSGATAANTNHYVWTTTRATLQDYDIVLHASVSTEFVRWGAAPLTLRYRTTTSNSTEAQLDVEVYDTAGAQVTVTGGSNLVNTEWTTAQINFTGSPTWTPGSGFLIKIRPFAKDNQEVQIGHLKMHYTDLQQE